MAISIRIHALAACLAVWGSTCIFVQADNYWDGEKARYANCDHERVFGRSMNFSQAYIFKDCTKIGPFFNPTLGITDEGAVAIANELAKDNVTLTRELYLDYNEITVVGITALAQALTTNTKSGVHVIDVSSNNIGPEGAQVLADMIHAQLSVAERVQTTRLNLARNNIGDEGAAMLSKAFVASKITTVDFAGNQIGDAGAVAVAEFLATSLLITHIDLSDNQIGDVGVAALAKALESNTHVQELNLMKNQAGDAGAQALGEALRKNAVLESIFLMKNKIGNAGVASIEAALKCCNTKLGNLGQLGLYGNPAKYKARKSLEDLVAGPGHGDVEPTHNEL